MFLISFCNNCIIILLFVKKELNKFTVTKMNILVSKPLKKKEAIIVETSIIVPCFLSKKKKKKLLHFLSPRHTW